MIEQIVDVSNGEQEFVSGIVCEKYGQDISTSTFQIGLGTYIDPPVSWQTPDEDDVISTSKRKIGILIDSDIPLGVHFAWIKIIDNPERIFGRIDTSIVVK